MNFIPLLVAIIALLIELVLKQIMAISTMPFAKVLRVAFGAYAIFKARN